jgi:hypothetical protein
MELRLVGGKASQQVVFFGSLIKENQPIDSQIVLREDKGNRRNMNYFK